MREEAQLMTGQTMTLRTRELDNNFASLHVVG
jgi:hypothetical protein